MTLLCSKFAVTALCWSRQSRTPWCWPLWPWKQPLTLTLKQGSSDVKTRLLAFHFWPTTLTLYNPNLARSITYMPNINIPGQAVQSCEVRQMDRQIDATKCTIFLLRNATQLIIMMGFTSSWIWTTWIEKSDIVDTKKDYIISTLPGIISN